MDIVKMRLAKAMQEIITRKPLEKITVIEICEHALTSRNAFYHHFDDKYDLINWIFSELFKKAYLNDEHCENWYANGWYHNTYKFLSMLKNNGPFYTNAYKYVGQNSLETYHYHSVYKMFVALLEQRKEDCLSSEEIFYVKLHCRGVVFMISQWAIHEFQEPPEQMAEFFRNAIPVHIMKYLIY